MSDKPKWTPGPWRVNPQTPCTVITPHGMISVSWNSTDGTADLLAEHAACLIAAAPDMAEALRAAAGIFSGDTLTKRDLTGTLEMIRAALRKATGETE